MRDMPSSPSPSNPPTSTAGHTLPTPSIIPFGDVKSHIPGPAGIAINRPDQETDEMWEIFVIDDQAS
ncbi:MAG: hypothetical protein ACI8X5_002790 [Planctomycetota bacterium]|jgi:hypothetical protein